MTDSPSANFQLALFLVKSLALTENWLLEVHM